MTPLPPNGTFPKIHPIWRRHPSLSQTEDEPGILIKDWGLCHTSSGTSHKGVAHQRTLKGVGATWQQSGETFFEVQSAKYRVQSGSRVGETFLKYKVQSAKYKVQSAKCKVQSTKCKVAEDWRNLFRPPPYCPCILPLHLCDPFFHQGKAILAALLPVKCVAGWSWDRIKWHFVQSLWSQHALSKIWSRLKPRKEHITRLVTQVE